MKLFTTITFRIRLSYTLNALWIIPLAQVACRSDEAAEISLNNKPASFSLLSPVDGKREVEDSVLFVWEREDSVDFYAIRLFFSHRPNEVLLEVTELADTSYLLKDSLRNGFWYEWEVMAFTPSGNFVSKRSAFRTRIERRTSTLVNQVFFVNPSGLDVPHGGTQTAPWRTIGYGVQIMPEERGDTLRLAPGVYEEIEEIKLPVGISLIGSGPQQTTLRSTALKDSNGFITSGMANKERASGSLIQMVSSPRNSSGDIVEPVDGRQKVSGFTIEGQDSLKAGIWVVNRNQVEISHVHVNHCALRGIVVERGISVGSGSSFLQSISIHHLRFLSSGKYLEDQEILGNLCLGALDGASVHDILVEDEEGYGIKFIRRGYFKNCTFYNIETRLNENAPIWGESASIELWNLGPGNKIHDIEANTWISLVNDTGVYGEMGDRRNLNLFNVRMEDHDGSSTKEAIELAVPHALVSESYFLDKGFGIAVWNMGRENITIRNNIFVNTDYKSGWTNGPAIYIDNSREWDFSDIHIYHNVFDTHNHGVRIVGNRIQDIDIRNNLFLNTRDNDIESEGTNVFVDHNLKFLPEQKGWSFLGEVVASNNLNEDPLIKEIAGEEYYLPLSSSPMIDAGVEVGLAFKGMAPDIGAYEVE